MGTGAEGELRVDLDGDLAWYLWHMTTVMDGQHPLTSGGGQGEVDGLKALLFPLLVPVAILSLTDLIVDGHSLEGEVDECRLQDGLVEECLLYVAFQTRLRLLERLETCLSGHGCHEVAGIRGVGCDGEFYFVILHKDVNFCGKITKNRENPTRT